MPISSDFTSVYNHDWDIDFTQCTPNGRLKYTELCNILQLTAGYHAEKGGISFTDMQVANQAWVLSRMRVEVNEMPRWRDRVTVTTWIVSLENSRSVRALEVHHGGRKIIGCETFWAVFNTERRRPEPLALEHKHFEKFANRHPTVERVRKISLPTDARPIAERKVAISDLDIVNHVNNVKYLEWCLDLAEAEPILQSRLLNFDMNFMKEMVLGDTASVYRSDVDEDILFTVMRNTDQCFALRFEIK